MDDLDVLADIARGPGGAAPEDAEAQVVHVDADFDALAEIAGAPPGGRGTSRKHEQRSWQLMQQARDAKKRRQLEREKDQATAEATRARAALSLMGAIAPGVARSVGVVVPFCKRVETEEFAAEWARLTSLVALSPDSRGTASDALLRQRAVSLVAGTALRRQTDFLEQYFRPLPAVVLPDPVGLQPGRHRSLSWQWDETAQRTRNLLADRRSGERVSRAKAAVQVLMQTGRLKVHESGAGAWQTVVDEPVLSRATFLEKPSADFILEALLRRFPVPLSDEEAVAAACGGEGSLVLTFSHDRASSNYPVLRWIFGRLVGPTLPRSVFPHAEACVLHGLQLARSRPHCGKHLVATAFSFTRFLRNWRSLNGLRAELICFGRLLDYRREPPPAHVIADREQALSILLGPDTLAERKREGRGGDAFKSDVRLALVLVVFCPGCLRHYCWDDASGQPCCADREEAVEKVTTAILNVLISRSWVVGTENRWTHTLRTLARLACGFLWGGALPECLDKLRFTWDVDLDNLEDLLAALVAAENPNSDGHRKLRLARICKVFREPAVVWQLPVLVTGLRCVDDFMYFVFGTQSDDRPSLLDILGRKTPRFADMQVALCKLLQEFRPDAPSWVLLRLAGSSFQDGDTRSFARCHLFQLSASLFEHFEVKWSKPPYSLLPTLEPDVPLAEKRKLVRDFLHGCPDHCLSLFLKRLKDAYPTVYLFLSGGVLVLRSWCSNLALGIDFSERAHYALRLQLRSTNRARNATAAANKVFLQEAAAGHLARHGCLPSQQTAVASTGNAIEGPATPANKRVVPAPLAFMNHKMAAFKICRAPRRPLTETEVEEARARHAREWADMGHEAKEHWTTLQQAAALTRVLLPRAEPPSERPPITSNLWGSPVDSGNLVPVADIVAERRRTKQTERRAIARHDPALMVKGPVCARPVAKTEGAGRPAAICSCWEAKQNVCRVTLPHGVAKRLDKLLAVVNSWVESLAGRQEHASFLALFRGHTPPHCGDDVGAGEVDAIVALALTRKKPKMQVFARCGLAVGSGDSLFVCPPVPFVVEALVSPSSLCPSCTTLALQTSDDLVVELVRLREVWQIIPLTWVEPPGSTSLLKFQVTGLEAPHAAHVRAASRPAAGAADLLEALSFFDAAAGAEPAEEEGEDDGDVGEDDGPLAGIPGDFAQDVADELEELDGVDAEAIAALEEALAAAAAGGDAAEVAEDSDVDAAVAALASAEVPAEVPQWLSLAASAVVDEFGHVTSPEEPFASIPILGVIQTWPTTKPWAKRNVTCKCCLGHGDCATRPKKRNQYKDEEFVSWLLSGRYEPGCSPRRAAELRDEHMSQWAVVVDYLRERAAPTTPVASTGAASSSGH